MVPTQTDTSAPRAAFLVERIARRDDDAVELLYRSFAQPVFRFIYRRVREQREDAEEITLDTFLSVVSLAPTYRPDCSVLTWLCGIARVRIADFYRRQGRHKRIPPENLVVISEDVLAALPDNEASLDRIVDRIDAARLAESLMALLTEDEREALMLRYVEELSVREIATLLDRSEKGVEGLLGRAKKKQREYQIRTLGYRF